MALEVTTSTVVDRPTEQSVGRPNGSRRSTADGRPLWVRLAPALLAVPALALLVAIVGYPLYQVFERSFSLPHPGLANYRWFFGTSLNVTLLERTFLTALIVTVACAVLGVPYVFLMTIVSRRARNLMLFLVLVPFWTSTIVRNFAWVLLLQHSGLVHESLGKLGLDVTLIGTTPGVVIAMSQVLFPFMVLPLYATMSKIDVRLIQAAKSLGARPAVAFSKVYFPLIRPGVLAGAVLVFVLALGFYITPAMVGSSKNTLIASEIWNQINGLLAWGPGCTMAVVLLVLTLALLGIAGLAVRRSNPIQGGSR